MHSSLDRELRDHLQDYLAGAITLDQLKDWLVDATWHIKKEDDDPATKAVYEVHLALADQSSGLTTEDEMREELSRLAHLVRVA
jgi:Zn-dependent oligopeptidase